MAKFIFRNTWLQALSGAGDCDVISILDALFRYVWGEGTKAEISKKKKFGNYEQGIFEMMAEQIDSDRERFPEIFKEDE